eukprot:1851272-Rhodomonas_salina.1
MSMSSMRCPLSPPRLRHDCAPRHAYPPPSPPAPPHSPTPPPAPSGEAPRAWSAWDICAQYTHRYTHTRTHAHTHIHAHMHTHIEDQTTKVDRTWVRAAKW